MLPQLIEEFDGHLTQAISDAQQLQTTLDLEYDHLKNSDLEAFQELQVRKQHDVKPFSYLTRSAISFVRRQASTKKTKTLASIYLLRNRHNGNSC